MIFDLQATQEPERVGLIPFPALFVCGDVKLKLTIDQKTSLMELPPGANIAPLVTALEGRKEWLSATRLRFETSEHNLRSIRTLFPGLAEEDRRANVAFWEALVGAPIKPRPKAPVPARPETQPVPTAGPASQFKAPANLPLVPERFVLAPSPKQREAYDRFKGLYAFALFDYPGSGKTKTLVDILSYRWQAGLVTGFLCIAWPSGVPAQWIEEQIPAHIWPGIRWRGAVWNGRRWPDWVGQATPGELQILTCNVEMVNWPKGYDSLLPFLRLHGQKCWINVDESQTIKNPAASRTKKIEKLGSMVGWRSIMTGTPIAKNLVDEWSQFNFLDRKILGHKYVTSFRAEYCIMGGFENRVVVAHRNLDKFNTLVAPYIARGTKEDLGLPPQIWDKVVFDLTDEQRRHQKALKDNFLTMLDNGTITSVTNAASLITRLQQLACGYLVNDDGSILDFEVNPRMEALARIMEQLEGKKKIIWCRFHRDVELIKAKYGDRVVTYYGGNNQKERANNKALFLEPDNGIDLVATPDTLGAGHNMQGACRWAVYYSNSFKALDRWQSEDRIHRRGTTGTVTYYDLVARGSVDTRILANLRDKKSFSDMVLNDVRRMIDELY